MSILIVEDNDKNRMLMRDVLAFKGYRRQEPYRHDLRTMNSSPAGLPVLCDEICDELGCEMPRDSTDRRQLDRAGANGRPISRFRRISDPVRTALRCDAPQVQRCYADRASPRPNSSSASYFH